MNLLKFVIFLCWSLSSLFALADSRYLKLIDEADKAIGKGEYSRAIGLLDEALCLEPDNSGNVMLLSNIGMLSYYVGRDTMAINYLTMAHQMAPESVTILSNRAKVFSETGQFASAIRDFKAITQLDSTLYRPYLGMGVIYLTAGDTIQARQALDRMKTLTDTSGSKECTAALAWFDTLVGNSADAVTQYSILIDMGPDAGLYAARAQSYVALEYYTEASEDIAEGLKLDPECAELYVARAFLNKRTYRNDDALADAQRAVDLGADRARVRAIITGYGK